MSNFSENKIINQTLKIIIYIFYITTILKKKENNKYFDY